MTDRIARKLLEIDMAKQKPKPKRAVVTHPATPAGGGIGLESLAYFLPPSWQPWAHGAALVLGALVPVAAAVQAMNGQRAGDSR